MLMLALAALAACSGDAAPADRTASGDDPSAGATAPVPLDTSPAATPAGMAAADEIPPAFRGRWGMTAADCEKGRSDAKGLMTLGATGARFYESAGVLESASRRAPDEVGAHFAFTGEGMTWRTQEMLTLRENGDVLVRSSTGPDGQFGPFTYRRCR
ncbi:hypothetical protein EYB45_04620 [Erythrobacteraceae bacterium CFH 75059]|uniref:hypothetical protein n=1 Tax=Qipengyuania thermophila TaxID=2509361 RepID=UPI0010212E6B|nr:hypothetical protein [Qipengyuania thermophila]TCD04835.1 hypothetical protein EYB45_04620 [Erythrobacteraceae bacterium CFH 75059]